MAYDIPIFPLRFQQITVNYGENRTDLKTEGFRHISSVDSESPQRGQTKDIRDNVHRSLEMLSGMEHITPEVKCNWNIIQF